MGRFALNFEDHTIALRRRDEFIAKVHFYMRATATAIFAIMVFDVGCHWATGFDLFRHIFIRF